MAKKQELENEIVEEKDQKVEEPKKLQNEGKHSLKDGGTRLS